ncbi:4F2 cell-surface antigen heavy chain-like [Xyrauchen texanus]|uniref:4F2 cell-surface antigen heavy chain-like n=1 Tax=Xyrauchen texanus TaxID=154827 RepID=UPI002242028B|nr:4F2 cell-surface antigen heavy chain-like [Xyrauchen texanus]XP_051966480.1 4F2 cell-surface antigen heavy chain-like [Xyrauchen texanus]
MPLHVEGDPGYGTTPGGRFPFLDGSEAVPLLIPEPEVHQYIWKPLSKEELEKCAGGPGWKKFRSRLVLVFWISWLIMLGTAVAIIIQTPRAVYPSLHWWQRDVFFHLQPALFMDVDSTETSSISKVSEQLPYLKSLGVGAVILEGLFPHDDSPLNLTEIDQQLGTLPQFKRLIKESHKAGVKIMLDLCALDLSEQQSNGTEHWYHTSGHIQDSLRYWLEQGVSGFAICDTDAVFTAKTLMEWSVLMQEFSSQDDERILMVWQTENTLPTLNTSNLVVNGSLVELVTKSLIPPSHHPLSVSEVAQSMEASLQIAQGDWLSWTVGGDVPCELQRAILVLIMTLPGTPIIKFGDEVNPIQDGTLNTSAANQQYLGQLKQPLALFHSLRQSRAREEALQFGSFSFLPFNATMSSSNPNSTAIPPLAFLRSWGCVHFLVMFNLGFEPHTLDPDWAPSLPKGGVFLTSSGLDRLGPVSLRSIVLQPHEAIVIKLFESDNV